MPTVFRPGDLEGLAEEIIIEKVPRRMFVRSGSKGGLVAHENVQYGQRTHTYEYMTIQGRAVVTAWGGAIDVSGTDIFVDERTVPLRPIQKGWTVNQHELDSAKFAKRDLRPARMTAAAQQVLDAIDQVGFTGFPSANIYGICNQPNANLIVLPADGVGGSTAFADKTAAQIVRDLETLLLNVPLLTDGTYMTPCILLPVNAYIAATRAKDASNDNESALTIFRKNARQYYPNVEIKQCPYLNDCGPGGTSVAISYNPDKEYLEYIKTPGVRRSKVHEVINGFQGYLDTVVGGVALKQPISFNNTFGV